MSMETFEGLDSSHAVDDIAACLLGLSSSLTHLSLGSLPVSAFELVFWEKGRKGVAICNAFCWDCFLCKE